MISFIKSLLGKDKEAVKEEIQEASILQTEAAGEDTEAAATEQQAETAPETVLSLHPDWENKVDPTQKYTLAFMVNQLEPLPAGYMAVQGLKIIPHEDGVEVTAFVRNGSDQPLTLGERTLCIVLPDDVLFARQSFNMAELGELPPHSARPWSFVFNRDNFLAHNIMVKKWKLAFEQAQKRLVLPHKLEMEESWLKVLSDGQKQAFIDLAKKLPPINEGEINLQSVSLHPLTNGSLQVIVLFRNGTKQPLFLNSLPLAIKDAQGDVVAQSMFELENFKLDTDTSKPWLFIFPKEAVQKENPDLSRWGVYSL
ncbi:accessory Sec system S-layer assembly protein [Brevibacillus dissolubilis]|uniref:accessory Sec system S-layer assembly protein n=1 Tax=Brevibacillus dissolubilis TaxID=1844116 RepID=UPI001117A1B7|nr:accessory Sec system S-layer assembly protein [Brevibacillus dissolubilis]